MQVNSHHVFRQLVNYFEGDQIECDLNFLQAAFKSLEKRGCFSDKDWRLIHSLCSKFDIPLEGVNF